MPSTKEQTVHKKFGIIAVDDAYVTDAGNKVLVGKDKNGTSRILLADEQYWENSGEALRLFVRLSVGHAKRLKIKEANARARDRQHLGLQAKLRMEAFDSREIAELETNEDGHIEVAAD